MIFGLISVYYVYQVVEKEKGSVHACLELLARGALIQVIFVSLNYLLRVLGLISI